ncbi:MAG TPA: Crp/Fnr family transcriptional regulator [Leucothrix mucor]|nr:Crp/Fnr family transcriptional regulator [Leucothrix mucor]
MLSKIPLFAGFSSTTLEEFSKLLIKKEFSRNQLLISQGDNSRSLFFIVSGRVKVFSNDDEGKQTVFAFLNEGDYCGELSLLDAEPRSASVISLGKTEVLQLTYEQFDTFLQTHPNICYPIFKALTSRIREIDQTICSLASLDIYGRLIQLLYKEAREENGKLITQRLTQQDIAEMVGSSREMVSRILTELRKGGYIVVEKKRISIEKKLPRHW